MRLSCLSCLPLLLIACHIPEPDPPAEEGAYGEVLSETLIGGTADLVAASNTAFACLESGGLQTWDVSNPASPSAMSIYYGNEACREVDMTGNRLLVGTDGAFRSFSPNNMMIRGEYITGYDVRGMTVDPGDGRAWLTGLNIDGLAVLEKVEYREDADMRSIDLIILEGDIVPTSLSSRPEGMFLLTEDGNIEVLDTDLISIGAWSSETATDQATMSMGSGDYIYLSLGEAGVVVLDARDPENLAEVSRWEEEATWGVTVVDDLLYVGIEGGVTVLDLSDPAAPAHTGAEPIAVGGSPQHIWVDGGFGYTIDGEDGVMTIFNLD